MEAAESELGMPARAGKFVLKIALNLLERHYRKSGREDFDLIY
jgi:predicted transposase YbfD/YdcC